jgi:hypothetical protein
LNSLGIMANVQLHLPPISFSICFKSPRDQASWPNCPRNILYYRLNGARWCVPMPEPCPAHHSDHCLNGIDWGIHNISSDYFAHCCVPSSCPGYPIYSRHPRFSSSHALLFVLLELYDKILSSWNCFEAIASSGYRVISELLLFTPERTSSSRLIGGSGVGSSIKREISSSTKR